MVGRTHGIWRGGCWNSPAEFAVKAVETLNLDI